MPRATAAVPASTVIRHHTSVLSLIAKSDELRDADLEPVQLWPRLELPSRSQEPAKSTMERFERWFTHTFIPTSTPMFTPEENYRMKETHRRKATVSQPKTIPIDFESQQQSDQGGASLTQQVVQIR